MTEKIGITECNSFIHFMCPCFPAGQHTAGKAAKIQSFSTLHTEDLSLGLMNLDHLMPPVSRLIMTKSTILTMST